jgi:hypothetical protein
MGLVEDEDEDLNEISTLRGEISVSVHRLKLRMQAAGGFEG